MSHLSRDVTHISQLLGYRTYKGFRTNQNEVTYVR